MIELSNTVISLIWHQLIHFIEKIIYRLFVGLLNFKIIVVSPSNRNQILKTEEWTVTATFGLRIKRTLF